MTSRKKKPPIILTEREKPKGWFEEYKDLYTMKRTPMYEESIIKLGMDFVTWAQDDKVAPLHTSPFFRKKGMSTSTIAKWRAELKEFDSLYLEGLQSIGERRDFMGLYRLLDGGMVRYNAPKYDKNAKEVEEWRSSLRKEETESAKGPFIVQYPEYKKEEE